MVIESPPANPKTLYQEALDLAESLDVIRHGFSDLRGEAAALTEMSVGPGTSLTAIVLHCKWLAEESRWRLAAVRQEIDRLL